MNIGYIGLGALGGELARRLVREHRLTVWDVSERATAALGSAGASVASSAPELARKCEVVLLCLPRSSDVRQVVFGPGGLAEGLSPGKLLIDQTSGFPSETRAMAQELAGRGVHMIDAAVSASPHIVAQGSAILMAGGPDDVYERARPVLGSITSTIYRCGTRVGDGQAMKIANNAMNAACRLGTLELVAMGKKAGLSLASMAEGLNQGAARNQTTEKMLPALVQGKASTNFALSLMLKDVNQAVLLGLSLGMPLPICETVRGLLQIGLNTVGADARLEDMVGVIESMAGTRLSSGVADEDEQPVPMSAGGERERDLLELLRNAVAAVACAVTYECVAAGRKHGLSIDDMYQVLTRTSGWSASAQAILPALAAARAEVALNIDLAALRQVATLSIDCGAPTTIASVARTLFELGSNQFQSRNTVAQIALVYEALGAVNLFTTGGVSR